MNYNETAAFESLIIFTKNPIYGQVKTRLAATVGNDKALSVYKLLIGHTHSITKQLKQHKIVFYADAIAEQDIWTGDYSKQLQEGNDLGEKMKNAFQHCFQNSCTKAVIIGTDCPELNEDIILSAFERLDEYDVVIGPAADGGYYLLGMKQLHEDLFYDIEWSTNEVFNETLKRCTQNGLSYFLLPLLHDVDIEKDLPYMSHLL